MEGSRLRVHHRFDSPSMLGAQAFGVVFQNPSVSFRNLGCACFEGTVFRLVLQETDTTICGSPVLTLWTARAHQQSMMRIWIHRY